MSKPRSRSNSNVASWFHRKAQLKTLLGTCGDDEEEGLALDRILNEQSAVGKTQKSVEIENLRFSDKDLISFGPLADAQFGTVELVNCRLDGRVYVRKRISKKFAVKTREQCSPQHERHILLLALKSQSRSFSSCAPHMLCAYQCPTYLNIVMEYAAGGSLWDVLESSSDGRLAATDLAWWAPQCVAAIDWLHSRAGFAHRDIKPHNFVVRPGSTPQLLLIDFGSAAPLLKPGTDGVQLVPRSSCLVPCGTCDYISPEVLQAHEEALVALEMSDDERDDEESDAELCGNAGRKDRILQGDAGYGREIDWWSLGAMLYELAFGVAPFFADDIRQTYARIMTHESSLNFDRKEFVPPALISLIKGLLTHHECRLGRHSADELRDHEYFKDIDWSNLSSRRSPPGLLLPEFTYTTPIIPPELDEGNSESSADASKPFAFSVLFQSSITANSEADSFHPNQQDPISTPAFGRRSFSKGGGWAQISVASFIGFSWGPPRDAFDDSARIVPAEPASHEPGLRLPPFPDTEKSEARPSFVTPKRPSRGTVPPSTVRVTSVRRNTQARPVSDREAMRVLVNCVGQSARKRVLESGKKPKVLLPQFGFGQPGLGDSLGRSRSRAPSFSRASTRSSVPSAVRKELRFDETTQIMPNLSYTNTFTATLTNSGMSTGIVPYVPPPYSASDSGTVSSEAEGPPSPSPSPRPGSAMSMLSMSRRSATPTVSGTFLLGAPVRASSEPPELRSRGRADSFGSLRGAKYRTAVDMEQDVKEAQPRRARFVESPASSPEPRRERVLGTPHPSARKKGEEKGVVSPHARFAGPDESSPEGAKVRVLGTPHPLTRRKEEEKVPTTPRARFAEMDEGSPEHTKGRAPGTPYPRGGRAVANKVQTPHRARFSDSMVGDTDGIAVRAQSTPHPIKQARRDSKPPLQARRPISSTPARVVSRPAEVREELLAAEDVTIRGPTQRNDIPIESEAGMDDSSYLSDDETETLPDESMQPAESLGSSTANSDNDEYDPPGGARDDFEGDGRYDDMEQRYKQLLEDLANVRLHIDSFVSQVRGSG